MDDTMASADSFFEAHSPGQATQSSPGSSPRRQGHLYKSIHPGDYNPKMDATKTGFKSMGVKEKRPKATFGQPLGTLRPDTMNYTKAHQGEPRLPQPGPPTRPKEHVKPPVPPRDDRPVQGLVTTKARRDQGEQLTLNFVVANAIETILAQPKRPVAEPPPTSKKDYGQVPQYLQKIKKEIEKEKKIVAEYVKQQEEASQTHRIMPEDEKEDLLYQLKMKWETVNNAYQKLPLSCDTSGKKQRKELYEKELAQLEKDIKMLSRPVVMVEMH